MKNAMLRKMVDRKNSHEASFSAYEAYVRRWRLQRVKKLLLLFGVMVAGFSLSVTVIGAIVGIAAFICIPMEIASAVTLGALRRKCLRSLRKEGKLEAACRDLAQAQQRTIGTMTCAWTQDYLFTDSGTILPMHKVAWIYESSVNVRWFFIRLFTIDNVQVKTLDGSGAALFMGKIKDRNAYTELMAELQQINGQLQVKADAENEARYQQRVADYMAGAACV